ncbi:MAG: sensor histidine kinase N-terminal domain-containing protein, partial [Gammaproteobacteria bacterium]|nr:sensor histidine kinase N-terminal domain-containing protein [Gammaproteobacteria bacterium]
MPYSIQKRLLIALFSITLISWFLIAIINSYGVRSEIEELFDAHLAQSANILLSLVNEELYEEYKKVEGHSDIENGALRQIEEDLESHKHEKLLAFQITVSERNFHFSSAMAPKQALSDNTNGFSDSMLDGINWRVYTLQDPESIITIRVAEPHSVRDNIINELT